MGDRNKKRKRRERVRYHYETEPGSTKILVKDDFQLSPEDERIIRAVELRKLREQGYLP